MTDILYRLKNPPFGVETTERHMFSAAADRIEALERENERLRDINAILEDCMSKGMVIRKKETE